MSFGTTLSITVLGGGSASYKLWHIVIYSNGCWEAYRRFQGDFFALGGGVTWEDLSIEELIISEENFYEIQKKEKKI